MDQTLGQHLRPEPQSQQPGDNADAGAAAAAADALPAAAAQASSDPSMADMVGSHSYGAGDTAGSIIAHHIPEEGGAGAGVDLVDVSHLEGLELESTGHDAEGGGAGSGYAESMAAAEGGQNAEPLLAGVAGANDIADSPTQEMLHESDDADDDGDEDPDDEEDDEDERLAQIMRENAAPRMPLQITPAMVAAGQCDIQGINWAHMRAPRETFRADRVAKYSTYRNIEEDISHLKLQMRPLNKVDDMYRFWFTDRNCRSSVMHFQLRHLVAATSKNDVFVTRFRGEYVCKRLGAAGEEVRTGIVTDRMNGITNHMQLHESRSGVLHCNVSSNDAAVRIMNMERLEVERQLDLDWAVNCSAMSPDRRLLCIVGDTQDAVIASVDSGEALWQLGGHVDFSFGCAWSGCGRYIATGNQDLTTRIYDVRKGNEAVGVIGAHMSAVRSVHFTDDSRTLVMAEAADYVHIVDMASIAAEGTVEAQVIEFFGEIAGVALAGRAGERLFVGNSDEHLGGVMEFERTGAGERTGGGWGAWAGARGLLGALNQL